MSITKTKLNMTLLPETEATITMLAERDKISWADKAEELIRIAFEIEEDRVWNEVIKQRDISGAKFLSHKKAWK